MLKIEILSEKSEVIDCVKPFSVNIDVSLNIPAHIATVIIPYKKYNNCAFINIYDEEGLVFKGIIDEEQNIFSSSGEYIKIVARSMMSLLLDNEIEPVVIHRATENFLGRKYLEPLSINYIGGEMVMPEEITCEIGTTIYQLFEVYCSRIYGTKPFISPEGDFSFKGGNKNCCVTFSNTAGGINYNSLTEYKKPCQQITSIKYMMNNNGYRYTLDNPLVSEITVPRVRYLDCQLQSKTSVATGERLIEKSNKEAFSARIICPKQLIRLLGYKAVALSKKYVISEVQYSLSSKGEYSTLILESSGKEDENVAD